MTGLVAFRTSSVLLLINCFIADVLMQHNNSLANSMLHSNTQNRKGSKNILPELVEVSVEVPERQQLVRLQNREDLQLLDLLLVDTPANITLHILRPTGNHSLAFKFSQSPLLLPKQLKLVLYKNGSDEVQNEYLQTQNYTCFYFGYSTASNFSHVLSQLNLCDGELEAEVSISGRLYQIKRLHNTDAHVKFSMTQKDPITISGKCGNKIHSKSLRMRRSSEYVMRPPALSDESTRYIEMYVVIDHALYRRSGSINKTVLRMLKIVNHASSLFRKLNIYIALVGVEIWKSGNKIRVTEQASSVLREFELYRRTKISPNTPNDNAQLLVAESFYGNTIGQASSTMCSHKGGAAVSADHYEDNWEMAATTLAHELGHNLGLEHDDELPNKSECTCPQTDGNNHCIMFAGSHVIQPEDWSKCSIETLDYKFTIGSLDYCLYNFPSALQISFPTCGNYFVEQDEECDCGPADECDNKCCEPLSCKLVDGAQCATGDCCDISSCKVKSMGTVCRHKSDGQCDLTEHCDGTGEWCPQDNYILDGRPCSAISPSYCYEGKCRSRDTQCKYVWGDDSNTSISECYTVWNTRGNFYGHCGYSVKELPGLYAPDLDYYKCETDEDAFCGMLHCSSSKEMGVPLLPVYVEYSYTNMTVDNVKHSCRFVVFDVGLNEVDPGMVPEGSACGTDKWCRSQKCVEVPLQPTHCTCNRRGVCNQYHHCHCDVGYDPHTNCSKQGVGGSIDSGPIRSTKSPISGLTGDASATTTGDSRQWVGPVAGTLSGLGAVSIVAIVVIVLKKEQIRQYINSRKYRRTTSANRTRHIAQEDAKISSSSTLSADHVNNRHHNLISSPILESTTNNTTVLCDIPSTNSTNQQAYKSTSNPIYYSDIDFTLHSNIPLRVKDMCRLVPPNADSSTYSECQFSNTLPLEYDDFGEEAEEDGYENVEDLTPV